MGAVGGEIEKANSAVMTLSGWKQLATLIVAICGVVYFVTDQLGSKASEADLVSVRVDVAATGQAVSFIKEALAELKQALEEGEERSETVNEALRDLSRRHDRLEKALEDLEKRTNGLTVASPATPSQ